MECLAEIRRAAEAIQDLAMVYGFEGVETIASRMIHTLNHYAKDRIIDTQFIDKLREASQAIQEVVALIDEQKEREIIRRLSKGSLTEEELEAEEEPPPPLFEIKEDKALLSLLDNLEQETEEDLLEKEEILSEIEAVTANEKSEGKSSPEGQERKPEIPPTSGKREEVHISEGIRKIDFSKKSKIAKRKKGWISRMLHIFGL